MKIYMTIKLIKVIRNTPNRDGGTISRTKTRKFDNTRTFYS